MKSAREPDFRVCPNCGARNKAKWEFCVRCSESLQGVPLGEPDAVDAVEVVEDYGEGPNWGSIFGTLILIGIGIGVYQLAKQPRPAPPPQLFTVGTLPPSLPTPPPAAAKAPGREEYEAGMRLLSANDPAGAAPLLARATSLAPDEHVYRHAHAVALWQSGEKEAAIDQYRAALRLHPGNPVYTLNLARALSGSGRRTEALGEYESLIQQGNLDALREAAPLLADTDPVRARDMLRRAAAAQPGDAVLKQHLASMLEKTGDASGASQLYSEILETNPDAHITRGLLAEIHLRAGRTDEAVGLFRSGLQRFPDVPLLHRGLASALERSGAVTEAISEYREYARLAPNAPDAQQLRERADQLEKQVAPEAS